MEHYLYFAEGNGADAAGDAVMFPVSRFIGVEPISATTTGIYFRSVLVLQHSKKSPLKIFEALEKI